MKFYNPFKPHLVQFNNGKYAIRRYRLFSWEYRDRVISDKTWFISYPSVVEWCCFSSRLDAEQLLLEITAPNKKDFGTKVND